jgi:hypothetical protein
VIGGIIVASACASAETIDQGTFRCNASNGHYDAKAFLIPSDTSSVSGEISVHSADAGPEWTSLAKILVHQHGAHYSDGDCSCDGIAINVFKNPDHVDFYMTTNGQNVPIGRSPFDTPITFKISISPEGVMTVTIGKTNPNLKTIMLHHPEHNSLEMSCSGADVSFLGIATQ